MISEALISLDIESNKIKKGDLKGKLKYFFYLHEN